MVKINVQPDPEKQRTTHEIRALAKSPGVDYAFRKGVVGTLEVHDIYLLDIQEALRNCTVTKIEFVSMLGQCTAVGEDLDGRKLVIVVTIYASAKLIFVWSAHQEEGGGQ